MKALIRFAAGALFSSCKDLFPIVLLIAVFQTGVLQQPLPQLGRLLTGVLLVLIGLTLFVRGLRMALFPLGEELAHNFVRRGNLWWLLLFSFTLGFGTAAAEPALIAVADEAAELAALGVGFACCVHGRDTLLDGSGLIAFVSLFPIMAVMAYAQIGVYRARIREYTGELDDTGNLQED